MYKIYFLLFLAEMTTTSPSDLPRPRCDASEITKMLAEAAKPGSYLLVKREPEDVAGPVILVTASQWRCILWRRVGWLESTMFVLAPDGRTWVYGCQRDWAGTGKIIDPLDGLSEQQRVALEHRLITAACMPEPESLSDEQAVASILPGEPVEPPRPAVRGKR